MRTAVLRSLLLALLVSLAGLASPPARAERIKDLATVGGVRPNQLIGYGLVVGLKGTGDGADIPFTAQSLRSMLSELGVSVDGPLSDFQLGGQRRPNLEVNNIAAVLVTADLPPFGKPGQRIDVNVSAIGKAKSLRGGNLILTRLRGVDGEVYALAQGALTVTGVDANVGAAKVEIGVSTAGRIPDGAIVERAVESPFGTAEHIVLNLRSHDFSVANAILDAINGKFGQGTAFAVDGVSVAVRAPESESQRVAFMSMIENLEIAPVEPVARVVVNSRTGTVVINRRVRVTAAAVSHGTISVRVSATNEVSQPGPFSRGETREVTNAEIEVDEPNKPMFLFQPGVDLREIVDAVNEVGATPSALIAILEALKSSGSLRAELVVI
jgi:flagellar P-ring protein precursor FlgI